MDAVLYLYGSLLSALLTFAGVEALLLGRTTKSNVNFYIGIYFLLFALDNIIISTTEFVPSFYAFYDNVFLSTAAYKTILYTSTTYLLLWLARFFNNQRFTINDGMILGIYSVILLIASGISDPAKMTFWFLEPTQIMMIFIGARYLLAHRRVDNAKTSPYYGFIKNAALLLIVFGFLISVEDLIVIFFVDSYSPTRYIVQNRNFAENIFLITLSIMYISYVAGFALGRNNKNAFKITPSDPKAVTVFSTFDSFCRAYKLTDRERDVLDLHIKGKSTNQIAENLSLSAGTVKAHRHNIYLKTNCASGAELRELYKTYTSAFRSAKEVSSS